MWTNYWTLVNSYRLLFNLLWKEPDEGALKIAGIPQVG